MEQARREKWADRIFFWILLAAVSAVTLFLFHSQTHGNPGSYHSDMKAYILEMQGLESGYRFPYPVFFKFAALLHLIFTEPEFSVALATMLLNSLAIVIVKFFLNRLFLEDLKQLLPDRRKWMGGILLSLIAVTLFFVSMLYKKGGIYHLGLHYIYLGVFTPNPFHNATYLAARPFAVLSFFFFAFLLQRYENGFSGNFGSFRTAFFARRADEKVDALEYLLFGISLLLTTMTKPSFTLVLVIAAGLIMLYRFIRKFSKAKAKANFLAALALGVSFIPTFLDLLYQYQGVFTAAGTEESGVGFAPGKVWDLYCGCYPAAICLACGFPICVLICNFKDVLRDGIARFSWQIYGVGFATAYCFYEKGFRWADFNFSWGYEYGIFFCFIGALAVLLKKTSEPQKSRRQRLLIAVQWTAYLLHLICGLIYFARFMRGEMYY